MKKVILVVILLSSVLMSYQIEIGDNTGIVRNIKLAVDSKWASKIELQNGKKIYFSSPKSMFEFYFRPGNWAFVGVKNEADFKDILVTDFNTGEIIEARGAFYVYGSHAISPGGDDLVPFDSYKQAKEFAKKYNGKRVFGFKEVSQALVNLINGRI